jgi:hypothetical protein
VGQAAWLLDPIVAAIRAHVFAADKIHGDDTTVPVLSPGLGRTKTGRLWAYVRDDRPFCGGAPPAVAYFYSPDRTSVHPAAHLAGFTGLLQADAYAGFEKLYGPARTKPGPITEVTCWAHTRRGFFDDWEQHKSPTAKQALDRIAAIYAIEARAAFAPIAERVERRRELAPLLDDFFAWAHATVAKLSAKSNLAEAFRYAIHRREALSRFVTDGRLEIDNNIAENAMRCIAMRVSLCSTFSSVCQHWKRVGLGRATWAALPGDRTFDGVRGEVIRANLIGRSRNNLHGRKSSSLDKAPYRMICRA